MWLFGVFFNTQFYFHFVLQKNITVKERSRLEFLQIRKNLNWLTTLLRSGLKPLNVACAMLISLHMEQFPESTLNFFT